MNLNLFIAPAPVRGNMKRRMLPRVQSMIKRSRPISFLIALTALLASVALAVVDIEAATATGVTQTPPNTPVIPKTGAGVVGSKPSAVAPLHPSYVAPTENLTKVANAVSLQTYSLTTRVVIRGGLALTKPVCITVFYNSYSGRAYSNVLFQAYDEANGNRLVFNDQEGLGTPRRAALRIQLFEPGSGGCGGRVVGTGFDLPEMRVNLDPLYDVAIQPIQVTRIEDCPMLTKSDVGVRWYSPDDQKHETTFRFGTNKIALVPGSQWSAQALSASKNYHMPNVGLYGFYIPAGPTNVNLIPAPLAAGTPRPVQEIKFQMREPNRHCTAQVQYIIDRKLKRYVDPLSPVAGAVKEEALRAK
jgi:hypothetical protein